MKYEANDRGIGEEIISTIRFADGTLIFAWRKT